MDFLFSSVQLHYAINRLNFTMESSVIYGIVHAIFPHIDSAFRIPKNRYGLLLYRIEVQHYQNIFLCLRQPRLKDMRLSQRSL